MELISWKEEIPKILVITTHSLVHDVEAHLLPFSLITYVRTDIAVCCSTAEVL